MQSWEARSFHSVSIATNPEGEQCFLKRCPAVAGDEKHEATSQFLRTMSAVRALSHDSILRPTGYFIEHNDIVLEAPFCAGGNLREWLRSEARTVQQKRAVAFQLFSALCYMHSKGERTRFLRCVVRMD